MIYANNDLSANLIDNKEVINNFTISLRNICIDVITANL